LTAEWTLNTARRIASESSQNLWLVLEPFSTAGVLVTADVLCIVTFI